MRHESGGDAHRIVVDDEKLWAEESFCSVTHAYYFRMGETVQMFGKAYRIIAVYPFIPLGRISYDLEAL